MSQVECWKSPWQCAEMGPPNWAGRSLFSLRADRPTAGRFKIIPGCGDCKQQLGFLQRRISHHHRQIVPFVVAKCWSMDDQQVRFIRITHGILQLHAAVSCVAPWQLKYYALSDYRLNRQPGDGHFKITVRLCAQVESGARTLCYDERPRGMSLAHLKSYGSALMSAVSSCRLPHQKCHHLSHIMYSSRLLGRPIIEEQPFWVGYSCLHFNAAIFTAEITPSIAVCLSLMCYQRGRSLSRSETYDVMHFGAYVLGPGSGKFFTVVNSFLGMSSYIGLIA